MNCLVFFLVVNFYENINCFLFIFLGNFNLFIIISIGLKLMNNILGVFKVKLFIMCNEFYNFGIIFYDFYVFMEVKGIVCLIEFVNF